MEDCAGSIEVSPINGYKLPFKAATMSQGHGRDDDAIEKMLKDRSLIKKFE